MYILQPYSGPVSRFTCPECNSRRTFTRYVNTETGEELAPHVGKCARDNRCGYHFKPRQYFQQTIGNRQWIMAKGVRPDSRKNSNGPSTIHHHQQKSYDLSTIHHQLLKQTLQYYDNNHFITYCAGLFGNDITAKLIEDYLVGTSKHWQGATVFWQIDKSGVIRTGKIMLYDKANGKRVKKPFNHITWVHSLVGGKQLAANSTQHSGKTAGRQQSTASYNLRQCFFGEHLLLTAENKDKPVAIVESEKTALIASVYLPHFVWIAAGSLHNINDERCSVLKGRNVILFPDLNAYGLWQQKVKKLCSHFKVSNLLEHAATDAERLEGLDLADYLLKFNYAHFIAKRPPAAKSPEPLLTIAKSHELIAARPLRQSNWGQSQAQWDVDELQRYFDSVQLSTTPLRLNNCSIINNLQMFVTRHLDMVKHNNGKLTFLPYLKRLRMVRAMLAELT